MTGTSVNGLSRKGLEKALYKTTETLAAELGSPTLLVPDWSASEWLMARAAAAIHGMAPLLASTLRWEGPEGWAAFLGRESAVEQRRYLQISELLRVIDECLRSAEVPAVALKGAALYRLGVYRPGERPMADVDILVRSCDREHASLLLGTLGFRESSRSWKNTVFSPSGGSDSVPAGEPPEHPIKIELHERVGERLAARIYDITHFISPRDVAPGLQPYPSRASLMAHLLLHAAGAMAGRALRLVQLHDLALLSSLATDEDWAQLLRIGHGDRQPWWGFPPLMLTGRYYPARIPLSVTNAARSACPVLLRRVSAHQKLSDVSLSFPWMKAFPAIAWARSPGEACGYVLRRIVSGRQETSMRRSAAHREPGLSPRERRWLAISQGGRILRWLVSRPARPLTMRAVRASFGQRG
jgi:Uncharacterised nucleotidyltransferase